MLWGLFTSGYSYESLESAFQDARDFGYDYIEIWGGRPHAYAPDLLSGKLFRLLELREKYQMPIRVYTPEHNAYPYNYMLGDKEQLADCLAYFGKSLRVGYELGAEFVLFSLSHAGSAPLQERQKRLCYVLESLQDMAAAAEQKILLENLTPFESNQCTKLEDYAGILEQFSETWLQAICDVVVPFVQKEDPADYLRRLGPRLQHLHLVDSDGESETHLLPGEGRMPLARILRDFISLGYKGSATIELVTHYIEDPHRAARLAIERMKSLEASLSGQY